VHNIVPSALASFPELSPDTAGYFRYNQTLHPDAAFNPTLRAVLPIFPRLTDTERHRMLFINVPPTLFIVGRSETLTYNIFFVHGPEEMSSQRGWMVPPGTTNLPLFKERLQMNVDGSKAIFEQDRLSTNWCRSGCDLVMRPAVVIRGRSKASRNSIAGSWSAIGVTGRP
jgi:hypothetical protein